MIEILLPFYGDPEKMRSAVLSVLAQSDSRWRLTIVDDCSPGDDLAGWISTLEDERITYARNPARLGVAGNFNRCLALSRAGNLVVMGCDDLLAPDYMERMYAALARHPDAAAIHPQVQVIDGEGKPSRWAGDIVKRVLQPRGGPELVLRGEPFAARLMTGVWTYFPAICWNGDFLRRHRFRTEFETLLDVALLLELALEERDFVLTCDRTFLYRRHAASASSVAAATAERFEEERALLAQAVRRFDDRGWTRAGRAARRHATSRAHGLLLALSALFSAPNRGSAAALLRHAFGPVRGVTSAAPRSDSTAQRWYAERLETRSGKAWKRWIDVQMPYRWRLRRLCLGRTLDIGCGVGRNLTALEAGSVGVDHNLHAIALARKRGLSALTADEWLAREAAERESFDALLLAHVIEHMTAAQAAALVRSYLPALRHGGRVVVVCPQRRGFRSDPTHVEYFSGADIRALLTGIPGLTAGRGQSFPLPAAAGSLFTYNESWVVAQKVGPTAEMPA